MTVALLWVLTILGGVLYVLPISAKPAELARIAFFVGLFWLAHDGAHALILR
jgi:hypothetical protein